ncbi:Fe-S cluster assembly protein NifU [Fischerella thermalis]|jgi:NifU-like protein|uniref:Nitrogen fixation protein NifU n=1 Tax=Fischerella thermalis JSC-11 TaxID=741277 RepID=G6FYF3_9CYAN|nr:Fe-S cluster assembly protein NifU [Fischerella thermalis]PLZ82894.1 iron-sulfur cluster assembly scaffold protein NifU [Fischerella thermalis WC217]PMB13929.1 iron-sulfur cluster assembly scaffold protein NifU [Fischerella thermalis CCMEE 5328]EHC09730.1 Fe-S cluster assembly protein NifU [Fischerella thermalis JSC-11]MBF1989822.1 Fe-S cluster assembly protein NifU [Fischerella thermalis M58_A2018_009]MBF2059703.1 Fe-S cluster assembly protein NifU [Fischerella thermalis M66_A2018_004]
MWDYTDKVLELFYNPQHQGVIEDKGEPGIKVAVGDVGSIACGDALRLHLKVEEKTEKILEARFQTFGCTSAIASSEALVELIKGKTLDEALKVTNKEIANYLGGLPEAKMHCSVMGQEALEAAIYNYRGIPLDTHEDDDEGALVCTCFGISDAKIKRVIIENNLTTAEEVTNYVKAGGGCGSCLASIDDIIASVQKEKASVTTVSNSLSQTNGKSAVKTLTPVQKIALIQRVLDEEVRPILIADGGDVELFDVEGDHVKVILQGACGSCSSSIATLKIAIESRLRDRVSKDIVVEAV